MEFSLRNNQGAATQREALGVGGLRSKGEFVLQAVHVFVVSNVSLHREGLADLLGRETQIRVVGSASSVDDGIADVMALRPEVVLLDIAGEDRVASITTLVAAIPGVNVVALAVPETERDVIPCAEAGVAACLPPDTPAADFVATIQRVAAGESNASPRVAAMLLRRVATLAAKSSARPEERLTAREHEILGLIDEGLSNKQIARRLCIELSTVKNHVHNILEKLRVDRRSEAAARMRAHNGSTHSSPAAPAELVLSPPRD
jgi:two-component system nitrate/nitrite response regulator NarL